MMVRKIYLENKTFFSDLLWHLTSKHISKEHFKADILLHYNSKTFENIEIR